MDEQRDPRRSGAARRLKELFGKLGKKTAAAVDAGWEKASAATAGAWDKAGRFLEKARAAVAKHPVSPLLYLTLVAVVIGWAAFKGTYTRAYVLEVDGVEMGVLERQEDWDTIVSDLEEQVSGILGEEYDYEADVTITPVYTETAEGFTDTREIEAALFSGVEDDAYMTAWALSVDGQELGCAADKEELDQALAAAAQPYLTENTESYEFVAPVSVYQVTVPANTKFDVSAIRAALTAPQVEDVYYEVKQGDTFSAIARSYGMTLAELSVLNPEVDVNKLWVGDLLLVQQEVPFLSVITHATVQCEETIKSPVEYIETDELYIGDTKVKEQGEDGQALVTYEVAYLNGVEQERTELSSQVIKEATTTYIYTGTKVKPATASNGYFIWPVRGTITSPFGYRWGTTHLGVDIGVPYGTTVKAADGGEVTWAGWQGSYGKLVVITHDSGIQTAYAHNSTILVSVGQRVYQGQAIAYAGSTGNSTGPHCHFEVRINGRQVNPLGYLN